MTYAAGIYGAGVYAAGTYALGGWGGLHPDTISYRDRVLAVSSSLSPTTLNAHDTFFRSAEIKGYRSKILKLGTFAGNSFNAIVVPAIGSTNFTSVNFVSGDWSEAAGLQGGNLKYLAANFIPSANGLTNSSAGLVFYSGSSSTGTGCDTGAFAANNQSYFWYLNTGGNATSAVFDNTTKPATSNGGNNKGLYVSSRIANNDLRLYKNGTQIGTTNTNIVGVVIPTIDTYIGAINNVGSPAQYTDRKIWSWAAIAGMTPTEVLNFSTDLIALNAALGRA